MKTAVAFSFMIYLMAFVVLQQVVGRLAGARNTRSQQYPMFEVWRSGSLLMFAGAIYLMRDDDLTNLPAVRLAGAVIVAIGLIVSMWAQIALSSNWVGGIATHKQHRLVTHGPYRYVRHPLYAGMWISSLGLCLVSLNPLYGAAGLVWALAYSLRIPFEEAVLQKKFKRSYPEYADRTGAIIPRIRKRK